MSSLVAVLSFYQLLAHFALTTHPSPPLTLIPTLRGMCYQTLKVMDILEVIQGHTVSE